MQDLKKNFFQIYSLKFKKLISLNKSTVNNLKILREKLIDLKKINGKVIIFGNGGSAAIANHFSVDLTKVCNIRCINFNESSFLTCFANDYGYENWVAKALDFHCD
jgi:D-sedoheptulose 7-phosphate isomerase